MRLELEISSISQFLWVKFDHPSPTPFNYQILINLLIELCKFFVDCDLDMESPMSSEASTGYLQDAVVEWSERYKRRQIASPFGFDNPPMAVLASTAVAEDIQELLQVTVNTLM